MMFIFLGSEVGSLYGLSQEILMDFVLCLLLFVMVFVFCMMIMVMRVGSVVKHYNINSKLLEFFFGFVPIMILFVQILYSYEFIYFDSIVTNSTVESSLTKGPKIDVKIIGHQWFWTYEYVGMGSWMKFDSYMLDSGTLGCGCLRMLEVDNRLVLPVYYFNRVSITSSDVIHSWFLPFYGFKLDALPGVVNTHLLRFDVVGVYYGMCSEVCGAGHSYMPIVVEVVPDNVFFSWLEDYKHKYDIFTRMSDWYAAHGVSSYM